MSQDNALSRRSFVKDVAAAGAGAAFLPSAPAVLAQRSPSNVLGVAVIGVGTRGIQLLREAQDVPGTEIRIICDLYQPNIERAQKQTKNTRVRIVKDWEKAVADPDVDVVIIATPDFWHAPQVIAAAQARKDIYVEKGWCTKLEDARKMRDAVKAARVVMQLGHQYNSLPAYHKAREIYQSGQLGKVTLVRTYIDRTRDTPEWKFYTAYNITQLPKEANPDTIDWDRFIRNAPYHPFDAERFFTWRCWWDYGTGIAGDLMSHVWDGVNMIMGMGIPETAMTQGGTYFWKGDRNVPDMWHVLFDYPSKELAITFGCTFHNTHNGEVTQILGRDQTLEVSPRFCRTYMGEWKPEFQQKRAAALQAARQLGLQPQDAVVPPDYSMSPDEIKVSSHMENFFECVRSRQTPRCGVDRAFEEAVTIVMSVESFKRGRKVRWDPRFEEIL